MNTDFSFIKERAGVHQYKLDKNGLNVLLIPNASTEVVTVMVVYHVGSRNEAVGYTGSTHFLEHMMFKGTDRFTNFDRVLTPLGADFNATTSYDRTNYFAKVPKQHLKLVIALEADRMRNLKLRQSDRDSEMTVVRNEFENGKNSPFSLLIEEVGSVAFHAHPYHHPIIGWLTDVENVPLERMQAFYDQFYWPNNATIMVTGNFSTDEALAHIAEEFGAIPNSPNAIPQVYTSEPEQEGERRLVIEKPSTEPPMVLIGFRVPGAGHKDSAALEVIADLLGSSSKMASRLYHSLIKGGTAVEAFAWDNSQRDEYLFRVGGVLNVSSGADAAKMEAELLEVMERFKNEAPSQEELARVKKARRKAALLGTDSQMSYLSKLCEVLAATGSWEDFFDHRERYEAVTGEDVMAVAKRYFTRKNRTVGVFMPEGDEAQALEADATPAAAEASADAPEPAAKATGYAARTTSKVFDNGMTVQVMPIEGATTVGVSLALRAGDHYAPKDKPLLASLVSEMLNKGAKHASAAEMAAMLEEMGAGIAFGTDKFTLYSSGKVVSDDLGVFVALLGDCLRNPLFPEAEFAQVKEAYRAQLAQAMSDTGSLAAVALSQKVFQPGSTHYDASPEELLESLDKVTLDDLRAFHQAVYTPKSLFITVTGDVDEASAHKAVELALGSWAGGDAPSVAVDALPDAASAAGSKDVVHVPAKTSVAIHIGRAVSAKLGTPEYFVARMANDALGENTLSARLGLVVREKHGLTYGISSGFSDAEWGNGLWRITLTVNPKNVDKALTLVNEVLAEYVKEGVGEEELKGWIENLIGGHQVSLDNPLAVARTLNRMAYLGLGVGYLDTMAANYRGVSQAAVNDYIRANFSAEKLTTVICGTV